MLIENLSEVVFSIDPQGDFYIYKPVQSSSYRDINWNKWLAALSRLLYTRKISLD